MEAMGHSDERSPIPPSDLDFVLTTQIVVAWAGEGGEEKRLGWWKSDLVSEYGGVDLFRRILPATWEWATLQSVREAARRTDAEMRRKNHDADRILSLYRLDVHVDERIDERLQDLKRGGAAPEKALPGLAVIKEDFHRETFLAWVLGHGTAVAVPEPIGWRIKGPPPGALDQQVRRLVAALAPLPESYPLPYFRRPT
jgi:hypothetical protein